LHDEACHEDPDLRREVEALLEARDRAGDFLSPDGLVRQIGDLTPEPAASRIGTTLGSYEILGAGAMGEVYRARDTRLGRDVALKVLPVHVTHDSSRIARFQSEPAPPPNESFGIQIEILDITGSRQRFFCLKLTLSTY